MQPLQVDRASVELVLPVLDGPSPLPAAGAAADDRQGHACAGRRTTSSRRPCGGSRTTSSAHERACVTGSGSNYEAPFGARVEERYEGTTGVSKDDPALAWARGRTVYRITWPEADVRTETTLDLRSDAEAYHVVITLVAEELGPEPGETAFYRERRFERSFKRRLA